MYFPLENHFKQKIAVTDRCEGHNVGVRLKFSKTIPEILAKEGINNSNKKVFYENIPINDDEKSSDVNGKFLKSS